MWYTSFKFFDRIEGRTDFPLSYFDPPLTRDEVGECIPGDLTQFSQRFQIVSQHKELLAYADGGGIIHGEREFGYFSLTTIRSYYLDYGFHQWAPYFLPIAFNGGGKFYAYDFRDPENIALVVVGAGDIAYESAVCLGKTLNEVLQKQTNIEDELDVLYPQTINPKDAQLHKINRELIQIKQERELGILPLKTYFKMKQELENEKRELLD